jgi:hypothetical protein
MQVRNTRQHLIPYPLALFHTLSYENSENYCPGRVQKQPVLISGLSTGSSLSIRMMDRKRLMLISVRQTN